MEKILIKIKQTFLTFIIFSLPWFFLPITQEFFNTNKIYLLGFVSLFLLTLSTIEYFLTKKVRWQSLFFDDTIILFLITIGLSIILSSSNKVQALLIPNFGLITFFSLTIVYFYLSRYLPSVLKTVYASSLFVSLITIIFFFQPLKNINLPTPLQSLKNPLFTPLGNQLDLAIFIGFFLVYGLMQVVKQDQSLTKKGLIFNYGAFITNIIAFSLTIYQIFKPTPSVNNQLPPVVLPPFRLSWYAAVEILKQPLTALFGVGLDNFSSIFARVKDVLYNQSPLWQIYTFNFSRSVLLHIFTVTGLFGLTAFVLLTIKLLKKAQETKTYLPLVIYLLVISLLFPPSLIFFFLFYLVLASLVNQETKHQPVQTFDLSQILPFYIGSGIIFVLIIGTGFYFAGRAYLAEINFRNYLISLNQKKGNEAYNNLRQAIILNPFNESYRIEFSQGLLLTALNTINQKTKEAQEKKLQQPNLSETDRQNISQAIQTAINHAKDAVALNPQKAINWQNLANVYRSIIGIAQNADVWTISAYQRAIVNDPQNPSYRLELGGFFYSLGNYDEAKNLFQQVVSLKPDWPNAYYNLAWAAYQKQEYQLAANAMEGVLKLLDPVKDKDDYNKVKKELEDFKKKVAEQQPTKEKTTGEQTDQTENNLTLPSPIPTTNQPQIKLPKEASPEAK